MNILTVLIIVKTFLMCSPLFAAGKLVSSAPIYPDYKKATETAAESLGPALNGNGFTLSWDGKLIIISDSSSSKWIMCVFKPTKTTSRNSNIVFAPTAFSGCKTFLEKGYDADNKYDPSKDYKVNGVSGFLNVSNTSTGVDKDKFAPYNSLAIAPTVNNTVDDPHSNSLVNPIKESAGKLKYNFYLYTTTNAPYEVKNVRYQVNTLGRMKVEVIVNQADTDNAQVESIQILKDFEALEDTEGKHILGIEPSLTADGNLLVYNGLYLKGNGLVNGVLNYIYNEDTTDLTWSVPRPINEMYDEENTTILGQNFKDRYPLARKQIKSNLGNLYSIDNKFRGAYPWISWEGSDLFYQSIYSRFSTDGAVRSGWSAVGESTGWQVRHIDGAFRESLSRKDASRLYRKVLFTSGIAGSSSIWNPYREIKNATFPVHNRTPVMLFYASNHNEVAEVSFKDFLDGGYLSALSMNKAFSLIDLNSATYDPINTQECKRRLNDCDKQNGIKNNSCNKQAISLSDICIINNEQKRQYDLTKTPDTSGNNIFGSLVGDVAFSDEDYNDISANEYLGSYVSFKYNSRIDASFIDASSNEKNSFSEKYFSVEFAVKPLVDTSIDTSASARNIRLFTLPGVLNVNLRKDRFIEFNLSHSNNSTQTYASPASIELNKWAHLGMSWDGRTKEFSFYINGILKKKIKLASTFSFKRKIEDVQTFQIGPNGATYSHRNEYLVAIDEFKLSKVVRTADDFADSAFIPKLDRVKPVLSASVKANLVSPVENLRLHELSIENLELKAKLGSLLFKDNRLSSNNKVSCLTCHNPANNFADSLELSKGVSNNTTRLHTPHLINRAFGRFQNWEGLHGSVTNQLLDPISHPDEMGLAFDQIVSKITAVPTYIAKFKDIYGQSVVLSESHVQEVLGVFVNSIVSGTTKYDLGRNNESVLRGKDLFFGKARCAACHNGDLFTDEQFHNTGLGSNDSTKGRKNISGRGEIDENKFRTPSLINISKTAPYFHDGSIADLETVIDKYNGGGDFSLNQSSEIKPLNLSDAEKSDLLAFLNSLDADVKFLFPNELSSTVPGEIIFGSQSGLVMKAGEAKASAYAKIQFQNDGNLVIYDLTGKALWSSNTKILNCGTTCLVQFQKDGNLVIYNEGRAIWASNTFGSNLGLEITNEYPFLKIYDKATGLIPPDISQTESSIDLKNYSDLDFSLKSIGGKIDSCQISPSLPIGLSFNSSSCKIIGKISAVSAFRSAYKITARNAVGISYKNITLDVSNPTTLNYFAGKLVMRPGDIRQSTNVKFVFQADGNLVVYTLSNQPLWSSKTNRSGCIESTSTCFASFQADGNFVIYKNGNAIWESVTRGTNLKLEVLNAYPYIKISDTSSGITAPDMTSAASQLFIENYKSLNLSLLNTGGQISTCTISPALPSGLVLNSKNCEINGMSNFHGNQSRNYLITAQNAVGLSSKNIVINFKSPSSLIFKAGNLRLNPGDMKQSLSSKFIFQKDGNLVIYDLSNKPLWASNTKIDGCSINCFASFQADGNFVIYNKGKAIWASNTLSAINNQLEILNVSPFLKFSESDSEGYDVVLVGGQSNALGTGFGNYEVDKALDARIYQVGRYGTENNQIVLAKDTLQGWMYNPAWTNIGFPMTFAREYIKTISSSRKVLIVPAAKGATSIMEWQPGGELFEDMKRRLDLALSIKGSRLVAVLWHQGESDIGKINAKNEIKMTSADDYEFYLNNVLYTLRASFVNHDKFPIIMGDFVPDWQKSLQAKKDVQSAISRVSSSLGRSKVVSSSGLISNLADNGLNDDIHFCASSQIKFGERYFSEYKKLK